MLGVAAAALVLGPAVPADAHATLVGTSPTADAVVDAAPDTVELRFDEPVDALAGALEVYGPGGGRVDAGRADTADDGRVVATDLDGDAPGTYTVTYRVTSGDSHTISGSFVFHIGTRTGAVDVDEDASNTALDVIGGVGRWLGFAGTLVAAGASLLALVAGREDRRVRARLRPLAAVAAGIGAVGVTVALVASLGHSAGRGFVDAVGLVPDLAGEIRTARLAVLRAVLALLVAGLTLAGPLWRRTPAPAAVTALASLAVASFAGHAWTAPARTVAVAADTVHLGAVALWIGGVVALMAALPVAADRRRLATRFSALALGAVAVAVASGSVSGWQQVRTLDALTSTSYGQLLLVKVGIFLPLLVLGWVNRARLVPLVERTVLPLTRSLRAEAVVAAAVLAVTASLVHQAPARATVAEPFTTVVEVQGATVDATVEPAQAGNNDIHLYFFDPRGGDLAVDAVQVTAATTDVPSRRLAVTPIEPNHVTVSGASLPTPGTWTIEVTAVRGGDPLVFTFEVPIR